MPLPTPLKSNLNIAATFLIMLTAPLQSAFILIPSEV